jgi:hypothetical protein
MEGERLMMRPDFIITLVWAVGAMIILVLMGMEIIHNQKVVDRLLLTIPSVSALIAGYWFNKSRHNGEPK